MAHRAALGVTQVRVYDLNEVERVLVKVREGLDVEGDDRPYLVERAHLTDDPHDSTFPASVAAIDGDRQQWGGGGTRVAAVKGELCAPPLCALLDGCLVRRGVNPHLDVDRVGAVVDCVLQVGVLLIGVRNQPDNGHLVEVLAVHGEAVVAARRRRILQLFDSARRERLLVQLLPLRARGRWQVCGERPRPSEAICGESVPADALAHLGVGAVVINGKPPSLRHVAATERVSTKVGVAKRLARRDGG